MKPLRIPSQLAVFHLISWIQKINISVATFDFCNVRLLMGMIRSGVVFENYFGENSYIWALQKRYV